MVTLTACRHTGAQTIAERTLNSKLLTFNSELLPAPIKDRSEQVLSRKAYVVSYNKDTRQPNWVAWHLTKEHTYGDTQRPTTAWHEDTDVPEPRVYHRDYSGTKWDRGHMCPAGDNKWDADAMYESFLLTNACPQSKALNSGVWNQIEMSCREWARRWGDIYIVCGPIFLNENQNENNSVRDGFPVPENKNKNHHRRDTIGKARIPVPDAFFKVVADLNPEHAKGIAYIVRNNEGTRKRDMYVNTISDAERITGITFFPNLKTDLIEKVKNTVDEKAW